MPSAAHRFDAIAFVEDLSPRRVSELYPEAHPRVHGLHVAFAGGGEAFFFPFGAVVFRNVARERRDEVLDRLRRGGPAVASEVSREDFLVEEDPARPFVVDAGVLRVDRLTAERAAVVALTLAQSAAMEIYERFVESLFGRTRELVAGLERRGTVSLRTRALHRFIAEATATRNEVFSVLHLLDRPEAVWDDPGMDRIYEDLRAEFDLADRFEALSLKLRAVQESLELVLDTARDRRLVLLEAAIVALIVLEIVLALLRGL